MRLIICTDENDYTTPGFLEEIRSKHASHSPSRTHLLFLGDQETMTAFANDLAVPIRDCINLGPLDERMKPYWWWCWSLASTLPKNEEVVLCTSGMGSLDCTELSSTSAPLPIQRWLALRKALNTTPWTLSIRLRQLVDSLKATKCPTPAQSSLTIICDTLQNLASVIDETFTSMNPCELSNILAHMGQTEARLHSPTEQILRTHILRLHSLPNASRWVDYPPPIVNRLTTSPTPSIPVEVALAERLKIWSAIFYLRSSYFSNEERHSEGMVSAWRALETYAYALGVEKDILLFDGRGNYTWGPQAAAQSTQVSAEQLLSDLRAFSFGRDPIVAKDIRELRQFRNKTIWGHGLLGATYSASEKARRVTKYTIEQYEGTTSGVWRTAVRSLGKLPQPTEIPAALLTSIGVQV